MEARGHRHRQGKKGPGTRTRGRAWPGAQYRIGDERLHPFRSRHLVSFKNRGELAIAVEGDKRLFNQYGVMLVNPVKHPT